MGFFLLKGFSLAMFHSERTGGFGLRLPLLVLERWGEEVAGSSLSTSPFGVCSELLLEAAFCVASEGRLDTFSSKSKRPSTAAASSLLGCGW